MDMNTTTPSISQPPEPSPTTVRPHRPAHGTRLLRRLAWIVGYAALRGAATTTGSAAVTAVIWWIHTR
jgi:hypothetical protein